MAIGAALSGLFPSLAKLNPLSPQPVDQMPNPYLVVVADFDAANGNDSELDGYLGELWREIGEDLSYGLSHCHGFDGVNSAETFARAIRRCQVDTTMPFNDYWQGKLDLEKLGMSLVVLLGPLALAALALVAGLIGWRFAADPMPWQWATWLGAAGIVLGLLWSYFAVLNNGAKPLPRAPDSDLRSVLKALYLQQNFIRFATDMQGADPNTLHAAFGAFVQTHRPADLASPSQPPGVVRSPLGTA